MLRHNARPNQVLSFNRSVAPWYWQESLKATDNDLGARIARHKASFAACLAENAADAWNNIGGYAIELSVQHFDDECWNIVGEWAACLTVDDYTKELDCRDVANQLAREVEPLIKATIDGLDLNYNDAGSAIYFASNSIKDTIFNTNTFSLLRNTNFFKHINKSLNQKNLQEIFDGMNLHDNMPFNPSHEEHTEAFKNAIRLTFQCFFMADNQFLIDAVERFELEQVALASAQACNIIQSVA